MTEARLTDEFAAALRDPVPELLALIIARLAYPTLDPRPTLDQLDEMACTVGTRLERAAMGADRATALVDAIRADLGFHGDLIRYYDADNSYLNHVLAMRQGLPIMLSLVCMAIGRRLGLQVAGMGFPGHFMVQYADDAGRWYLDIFHGAVLTADTIEGYLAHVLGQAVQLTSASFEPVSPQALALRILNNLRVAYLGREDAPMAARVVELMTVVTPESTQLWWELGVLRFRTNDLEDARARAAPLFLLAGTCSVGNAYAGRYFCAARSCGK